MQKKFFLHFIIIITENGGNLMELECRVVKRNGESFLYRKYNDTAYLSKAANPGIILQKKRYECGLIEREDFVNNRFSSIPSHMRKDTVDFTIKDNNLLITGKLKKEKWHLLEILFCRRKTN